LQRHFGGFAKAFDDDRAPFLPSIEDGAARNFLSVNRTAVATDVFPHGCSADWFNHTF
jgi:hypothetical protein